MAKSEVVFLLSSSFLSGLILASFGLSLWWVFFLWLAGVGIVTFSSFEISRRMLLVCLLAGVLGVFYYHLFAVFKENREILPRGDEEFLAVVSGEPRLSEKSQVIAITLVPPYRGSLDIITQPLAEFRHGEELRIKGVVRESAWPERSRVIFPSVEPTGRIVWSLKSSALDLKQKFISSFKKLFSADQAALIGGLTFGVRADFSDEFKEAMRRSGTIHLVALSGYNISILILAVERLLRSRFSKRFFFVLATCCIGLFVLMVGAEASIVRAAIMGWLVLLASVVGRLHSFWYAVVYAALGMSLWNPSLPGSDLGFQLSFLSLLGIILLQPILMYWLGVQKEDTSFFRWKENLSTTIAAQLGVLPILLMNFTTFSLIGVVSNVFILWLVPFVMALGFLIAFLGLFQISLGIIVQPFLHILLSYILVIINISALFPILEIQWGIWHTLVYYGVLGWLVYAHSPYEKSST